jgi:hypothetical protein
MKKKKTYPNNGPSRLAQSIRLGLAPKTPENVKFVREWVKSYAKSNGRPETVEAYSSI